LPSVKAGTQIPHRDLDDLKGISISLEAGALGAIASALCAGEFLPAIDVLGPLDGIACALANEVSFRLGLAGNQPASLSVCCQPTVPPPFPSLVSAFAGAALSTRFCNLIFSASRFLVLAAGELSVAVTAAFHGLKVIVAEKDVLAGATAWSGGWIWAPLNPLARRAGIKEDRSRPRTYLEYELGNRFNAPRIDAFLDNAPRVVSFFERHTSLQFVEGHTIADIHAHQPVPVLADVPSRRHHLTVAN
jgi:hypothetical protein